MRTVRLPLLRGALFLIALAAISILLARGDNPAAEATSFEPFNSVSVSDPTPGANADIKIDFSLDAPDAFPNITNKPAIQFIPRQWEIHVPETEEEMLARIGGIAGTFNSLANIGIFGNGNCTAQVPVDFTMFESTPDTGYDPATGTYDPEKLASSLDLGGDSHPLGAGFSGQFVDDPNFATYPSDYGLPLVPFIAGEKWADPVPWQWSFGSNSHMYIDAQLSGQPGFNRVSAGDTRLYVTPAWAGANPSLTAGSAVAAGDPDVGWGMRTFYSWGGQKHDEGVAANGQMDPGEHVYVDLGGVGGGSVSGGDRRLFVFEDQGFGSYVNLHALVGGVTRYPDFLNELFHPEVTGNPLARQFGQSRVLWNPVSMNLVTFRPGQLPGYPATLGYPTVVVLLNPLKITSDPMFINITNDLCTPLSVASTNLGISGDNPETPLVDESGFARLTNPGKAKDHVFTLVVESQADADDDGIENLLDTCAADANINDLTSRHITPIPFVNPTDPDGDAIDGACDPLQDPPADWGAALISFNADEKVAGDWFTSWDGISRIYRDNDASGNITPGDDRLYHRTLPAGVVQEGDPDTAGTAYARRLTNFPARTNYWNDYKHAENVAVNGRYDAGENVFLDRDGDGYVGHSVEYADSRHLFEGSEFGGTGVELAYIGVSALDPSGFFWVADEDQDNFANRGDDCPTVANGVQVLGYERISLREVNFFVVDRGDLIGPNEQADTDGDAIGDACEGSEHGAQCLNADDDDGDGFVNDGCPSGHPANPIQTYGILSFGHGESILSGADYPGGCQDAIDNDGDGRVNDGCPSFPGEYNGESFGQCENDLDDDGDGRINDGCPYVRAGAAPETGEQCANAGDDDGDGLVNEGCPAVDPGDAAKMTPNGHVHTLSIQRPVHIAKHGIKLNNVSGPQKVKDSGARTYNVDVSNLSGTDSEDIQVRLRVFGCGTVNGVAGQNTAAVSVAPGGSGTADFTVDWTGCPPGLGPDAYIIEADACHAGDAAPAGFVGSGASCPGASDGMTDPNPLDDAPMSIDVEVGSTP